MREHEKDPGRYGAGSLSSRVVERASGGVGVDVDPDLPDPEQHPLPEVVGGMLRARAGDQSLHGALEVVLLQARAALVEVLLDLAAVGLLHLVVDEEEHALEDLGTVLVVVLAAAHQAPPFASVPLEAGVRPRSRT